ncbi:hypothetical protein J5N97_016094 [Dioscorea zingiberensis]|uniref:Uncharacterized protein n=1 Tax=Dioscorea zingiberensis TaxID=325984 RepID=A0A9D5CJL3_9LILI|nr:hypothetical protein J5N97_016094 [Dioscorea zingiberensis]
MKSIFSSSLLALRPQSCFHNPPPATATSQAPASINLVYRPLSVRPPLTPHNNGYGNRYPFLIRFVLYVVMRFLVSISFDGTGGFLSGMVLQFMYVDNEGRAPLILACSSPDFAHC